jgi:hypothetical protein
MPASMIVLIVMTVIVAIIAVYRWIVAHNEDDFLHIQDPSGQLIPNQKETARALNRVDHLGIGLTVATALYGIALLGMFLYSGLK